MKPIPRVSSKKYKGLGDIVEALAKPLVKLSDKFIGTKLSNCRGCDERKTILNKNFPF